MAHSLTFQRAVGDQSVFFEGGVLRYTALRDSGTYTFFTESGRAPEMDGVPVDFRPGYSLEGPF